MREMPFRGPVLKAGDAVKKFILFFIFTWLLAVSANPQADTGPGIKAAGCFIPTPKGVVVSIGRLTGKLHIPIGSREPGETAQDTAVREAKEETGLDIVVGRLLKTFEDNTVYLFLCEPKVPIEDYSQLRPVDTGEIAEVFIVDPVTMLNYDGRKITEMWRFRDDRSLLIRLFEQYRNTR